MKLGEGPRSSNGHASAPTVDWRRWMSELGLQTRRVRELVGLSQERLADRAGVSQGAVRRLESGRGFATPFLVVLRVNLALDREMEKIDPDLLSDEARALRNRDERIIPRSGSGGFRDATLMKDPTLEQLILLYRAIPERRRERVLAVMVAVGAAL